MTDYNLNLVFRDAEVGAVKRWDAFPIRVYATPDFRRATVTEALDLWQLASNGKITFQIVDNAPDANVVLDTQWPAPEPGAPDPNSACAGGNALGGQLKSRH